MKIKFICDHCGTPFDDEDKAKACEFEHARVAREKELAARQKAELLNAINSAVNLYVTNYHELPSITLTKENEAAYVSRLGDFITNLFSFA